MRKKTHYAACQQLYRNNKTQLMEKLSPGSKADGTLQQDDVHSIFGQ